MSLVRGFLTGVVATFLGGAALVTIWQFRPAGQVNVDLSPSDYAFLVSTTDNSLAGADFTETSMSNSAVSGQTIFIPKVWQQTKPGWGPGTRTSLPSGRIFIVPGVRETVSLPIELDTLDVVNVEIPFKVTVEIQSQDDAAKFITNVYGALEDAQQDGTEVGINVQNYIKNGPGASRIKEATQRVYGAIPLTNLDGMKSNLLADAKASVADVLKDVGLTVTEFGYDGDYKFTNEVARVLQERRDSLTELEAATKEVDTAREQAAAVAQRQAAFANSPLLALENRCIEISRTYLDEVIALGIQKGAFSGVQSSPEDYPLGVPTFDTIVEQFGCKNLSK